jgi:hypothetical protein
MKKLVLLNLLCASALAVSAHESNPAAPKTTPEAGATAPKIEWVKTEIQNLLNSNEMVAGENLANLLSINTTELNESSVVVAAGHFTSNTRNQFVITVPGVAKSNNLGWETNVLLLVEKTDFNEFKTIAKLRGDVAYQNSLVDIDGDGLQEILMVNRTGTVAPTFTYKLYSFNSNSYIYKAESVDNWTQNRMARRKHLKKGELLYNVLQLSYTDTDNDGKTEIVETWINFNYNGGRRIATIEQKKTMSVVTRIVTL